MSCDLQVVVAVVHYDVMPCLVQIAHQLEELRVVNARQVSFVLLFAPIVPHWDLLQESTANINFNGQGLGATNGHTNLENVSTAPMDKAERLLLRCLQAYVKELVRKRLVFNITKIEGDGLEESYRNEDLPVAQPRHCRQHWCICQFVDRMVLRRKTRRWYQKLWEEPI